MSKNFTKEMDAYENSNHDIIRGKYHFDIPHDIEPACYEMNIDYESHDDLNPDAYQYSGYIVVGNATYLRTSPLIIPYNTSATTEEAITLYEKRNTAFSVSVDAFSDDDYEHTIANLPYKIKFVRSLFRDYHEDESLYARLVRWDYNNSYQSSTVHEGYNTNSQGKGTVNMKVSDLYDTNETIHDINTIIFKHHGTRDRGTNNQVPALIEAPLILGTTDVYIQLVNPDTRTVTIDGSEKTVPATCGRGEIQLGCDLIYKAFMRDDNQNNKMKYGYESYRTDRNKLCKVGSLQLQYYYNNEWVTVPSSELRAADNYTIVGTNGKITQKPNAENGGISVYWQNSLPYSTTENILYRWVYEGKVGATFGQRTVSFYMGISPDYGTPLSYSTRMVMNTDNIHGAVDSQVAVCGKVQQDTGSWEDPTEATGVVTLTINNHTKTTNVNADGTFCINVSNTISGVYPVTLNFHDSTGNFADSTKEFNVTFDTISTIMDISDMTTTNPVTFAGAVKTMVNGTATALTGGGGTLTIKDGYQTIATGTVNNDGTFSKIYDHLSAGTHNLTVIYEGNERYASSTKKITVTTYYTSEIVFESLTNNTITSKYREKISVTGKIRIKSGNTVMTSENATGVITDSDSRTHNINNNQFNFVNYTYSNNAITIRNPGTDTVTLTYAGTSTIQGCTATLTINTIKGDINLTLSATENQVYAGGETIHYTLSATDGENNALTTLPSNLHVLVPDTGGVDTTTLPYSFNGLSGETYSLSDDAIKNYVAHFYGNSYFEASDSNTVPIQLLEYPTRLNFTFENESGDTLSGNNPTICLPETVTLNGTLEYQKNNTWYNITGDNYTQAELEEMDELGTRVPNIVRLSIKQTENNVVPDDDVGHNLVVQNGAFSYQWESWNDTQETTATDKNLIQVMYRNQQSGIYKGNSSSVIELNCIKAPVVITETSVTRISSNTYRFVGTVKWQDSSNNLHSMPPCNTSGYGLYLFTGSSANNGNTHDVTIGSNGTFSFDMNYDSSGTYVYYYGFRGDIGDGEFYEETQTNSTSLTVT